MFKSKLNFIKDIDYKKILLYERYDYNLPLIFKKIARRLVTTISFKDFEEFFNKNNFDV